MSASLSARDRGELIPTYLRGIGDSFSSTTNNFRVQTKSSTDIKSKPDAVILDLELGTDSQKLVTQMS
jgi:hypothetical protein